MSRETFGQAVAGAFLEAGDAVVEIGAYVDAIDELIEAAVDVPRLRRYVVGAILARTELARAIGCATPEGAIPRASRRMRGGS